VGTPRDTGYVFGGRPYRVDPHDLGMADTGEKVIFLDQNGTQTELEMARKLLTKGQELTVVDVSIGGWASSYKFEETGNQWFNTVMFQPASM
jgi:hypothetical protein